MEVVWTAECFKDLSGIYEYYSRDNEFYAKQVVARIIDKGKQVAAFPKSGRKVPEIDNPNIREVFRGNYRIIYVITDQDIRILTVVHGAMDIRSKFL